MYGLLGTVRGGEALGGKAGDAQVVGPVAGREIGRQSTYCHVCGTRTIGRDWYELSDWRLDDRGACTVCGTPTAGVFDGPPGDWGRKHMPVSLD